MLKHIYKNCNDTFYILQNFICLTGTIIFYFLLSYIRFHFGWRMAKRLGFGQPTFFCKEYVYYKEILNFPHYIRKHVLNSEVFFRFNATFYVSWNGWSCRKIGPLTIETDVVIRCVEKHLRRRLNIEKKTFKNPIGTDRKYIRRVIVYHLEFILPNSNFLI